MYLSLLDRRSTRNSVIDVSGDIDINSAPWLEDRLMKLLETTGTHLLVDLSGVTFIDCAGLRMLLAMCRQAEQQECSVRFTALSPQVRRLAVLTGMREELPLSPSPLEGL
jgi:anti-sigma B factor antagonist